MKGIIFPFDNSGSISEKDMAMFIKEINALMPWYKRMYYRLKNHLKGKR